ncbi:uncharacterized protein MELLADRAFT_95791 [Melampsora larici-populina 98AG31]|uniref:Uncharacterized protein n=1 Tax=Melampsora larici-populina (strain 98AG31 / pathotype 3-4-7) TaxID=747676 RepID=F4RD87_MELLP|nr:uncharacterized protein MELLADRAFT_95791 [Melampsora larici-populina 98AG31]EGG09359.1 hypothetical protein MELLADRAFT_95791 [Melampsora larici-populina 98AG31]
MPSVRCNVESDTSWTISILLGCPDRCSTFYQLKWRPSTLYLTCTLATGSFDRIEIHRHRPVFDNRLTEFALHEWLRNARIMAVFCSNILSNTQCNGLTKSAIITTEAQVHIPSACFNSPNVASLDTLFAIFDRRKQSVGWVLVLTGVLFSLTVVTGTASRFNPGDLDRFTSVEKFTAALGVLSSLSFFGFHTWSNVILNALSLKIARLVVPSTLIAIATTAIVFDILAFVKVEYELSGTGFRVGARDESTFNVYTTVSVALSLCFLAVIVLNNLLLRRISIASISESGQDGTKAKGEPTSPPNQRLPTRWLQTATSLSLVRTAIALLKVNTVVAREVIGLGGYCAYVFVIVQWTWAQVEERKEHNQFFTRLRQNSQFTLSDSSEKSVSKEVGMTRTRSNTETSVNKSPLKKPPPAYDGPHTGPYSPSSTEHLLDRKVPERRFRRLSFDTGLSFASLGPEDSASTAAFLPRPPPKPIHLRERTPLGPNGSVIAPLRESLLMKFQHQR